MDKRSIFNVGYHTEHHHKPNKHWSQLGNNA